MSGLIFRRRVKLDDNTTANFSKTGASISHRRNRLTVNSRGRYSVRVMRGLSFRGKLW
jgi:hypothetical protein